MIKLYDVLKIKIKDIVKSEYNLKLDLEEESKYIIRQQDTPLFQQIRLMRGYDTTRINELIFVEAKHNKKKRDNLIKILTDGFYYNSKLYVRFGKSNSQAKEGVTVFVDNDFYRELLERSQLGVSVKECVISKYESYRCLIFSACQFIEGKLPNIILVDEYKKILPNQYVRYAIEKDAEYVNKDTKITKVYKQKQIEEGYKDIKLSPFDGFGVHTPEMSSYFNQFLGEEHYTPIGYQVRLPFLKGMSIEVDLIKYYKDHDITEIVDIFGVSHSIETIDCIWNVSMWKAFNIFKNKFGDKAWLEYLSRVNKYGYKLGISKYSHHIDDIDIYRRLNFQYLQCLDLYNPKYIKHFKDRQQRYDILDGNNWGKIINLAKYSTELVEKIINGDKLYSLKYLGINDTELDSVNSKYIEAVLINDIMLQDPCINRMLKSKLNKTITQMKFGKIYSKGFYHTALGDVIGYLQYCAKMDIIGCLNEKEFFCKNIPLGKCLSFRSPLVDPSEVNDITIVDNQITKKYLSHFQDQDLCVVNMYDLSMPQQGGMDFDADGVYLGYDEIVVNSKISKPIVVDIDDKKSAKMQEYNKDNIILYELNSRDNRIGEITNIATSILNSYTEDVAWQKINSDNVSLLRLYQGKEIDFLKTGYRWVISRNLRKYLKKLPYFLLFNYPVKLNMYYKIKNINKKHKKEDKIDYNAYHSPSPLNELCDYITQWERKNLIWNKKVINTGYLLTNKRFDLSNKYIRKKIKTICNEFSKDFKEEINKEQPQMSVLFDRYKNKINEINIGYEHLGNYCIDVSYSSINTDKLMCWGLFSDVILKNLSMNSGTIRKSKIVKCDKSDIDAKEFLGKYYKLIEGEKLFVFERDNE